MASILHDASRRARTAPRVRAELQASKKKASGLARREAQSRTTVNKWRLALRHIRCADGISSAAKHGVDACRGGDNRRPFASARSCRATTFWGCLRDQIRS